MKYVVIKSGVYQHGAWGPYTSEAHACAAARALAAADDDCYHEWVVHPISRDGLGDPVGEVVKHCTEGSTSYPYNCSKKHSDTLPS